MTKEIPMEGTKVPGKRFPLHIRKKSAAYRSGFAAGLRGTIHADRKR